MAVKVDEERAYRELLEHFSERYPVDVDPEFVRRCEGFRCLIRIVAEVVDGSPMMLDILERITKSIGDQIRLRSRAEA